MLTDTLKTPTDATDANCIDANPNCTDATDAILLYRIASVASVKVQVH